MTAQASDWTIRPALLRCLGFEPFGSACKSTTERLRRGSAGCSQLLQFPAPKPHQRGSVKEAMKRSSILGSAPRNGREQTMTLRPPVEPPGSNSCDPWCAAPQHASPRWDKYQAHSYKMHHAVPSSFLPCSGTKCSAPRWLSTRGLTRGISLRYTLGLIGRSS